MQLCPSCGRDNPDSARFCGSCGTQLHVERGRQERKVVTVVFCDLVGFTGRAEAMDPEDVRALLTPYHARVRAELEQYGGTVEKFIGDAVVAVFGAPIAHEDDPERAVRAAIGIRDWAREAGDIDVRIAVNTGPALVSLDADPGRGEGLIAGDVINTASRLQTVAPVNGVLVGDQCYRATRHAVVYAEREAVDAKGKAQPVPVWEALETKRRLGSAAELEPHTPFVGRDRELHALRDAFERARHEREPQLVTLVAAPGSGKSRLVYELSQLLDEDPDPISWRQGRCLSYGQGVSFWALADIVKAEAKILDNDSPQVAGEKLSAGVHSLLPAADAAWVEGWLRPLIGLARPDTLHGAQDQTFPAWRRFLEAIAERGPTVFVVEDLHWADDGLLDFVDELLDWTTGLPLLLVATARPELLVRRPGWGGGKTNAITLSLPPLTDDETARLVQGLLAKSVIDAGLQQLLLERAGGNPLYAEEFARIFAEQGPSDCVVPETVHGIIAARLDALPAVEKALLQDASVLGATFWIGALAALGSSSPAEVESMLRELERRDFVRRSRRSSVEEEKEYVFRHDLVREIAYEQIPRAERSERHERAAAWIRSIGRADDYAELLAHHYLEAISYAQAAARDITGIAPAARQAMREAGDRALRLAAYRQGARFYDAALQLEPMDDAEKAALLYGAGSAKFWWSGRDTEQLEEAIPILRALGDIDTAARAALNLARATWTRGEGESGWLPWLQLVDELIGDARDSVVYIEKVVVRAGFHMVNGEYADAVARADEALSLLDGVDRPDLLSRSYDIRGCSRCGLNDWGGLEDQKRAIALAERSRSLWEYHHATNNLGVSYSSRGMLAEMEELQERWGRAFDEIGGTQFSRVWYFLGRADVCYDRGQWDEALEFCDRFLATIPPGGTHVIEPQARLVRGLIMFARGDDEGGMAELERARAAVTRDSHQVYGPVMAGLASALLSLGRHEEALKVVDEVLDAGPSPLSHVRESSSLTDFVAAAVAVGRGEPVETELAHEPDEGYGRPARSIARGDFAGAAELFAEMGNWRSEADMRLRAGGVHLPAALKFYRSVGADRFIREVEALLGASA
jgi:class 3 adenylate cyclase/tetratricopeptide (TPR) repeat protein